MAPSGSHAGVVSFATRLNSFAVAPERYWGPEVTRPTVPQIIERAATVRGLGHVDLNYPDHVAAAGAASIAKVVRDQGLAVNGLAMRYYGNPAFKLGAFTHPDPAVRREAIELTKRGVEATAACGATLLTLWLGQDGFDTPFQADYATLWQREIDAIREVAAHDPTIDISLEYKPDEPRAYSLLRDAATTLLAIGDVGAPNLGVTLDLAHVLYAGEQPAFAAALVARRSRILGVHLNDAYGRRDDGLMVGAVHTVQTVELLRQLRRDGALGVIYFDTFPDLTGLDPVAECEANIATVEAMLQVVDALDATPELDQAMTIQDAVTAQRIVQRCLLGAR
ncbi:MAG: sugar phosphate isomerase/epimerase family protein [Pseudomonadota bacterium]